MWNMPGKETLNKHESNLFKEAVKNMLSEIEDFDDDVFSSFPIQFRSLSKDEKNKAVKFVEHHILYSKEVPNLTATNEAVIWSIIQNELIYSEKEKNRVKRLEKLLDTILWDDDFLFEEMICDLSPEISSKFKKQMNIDDNYFIDI
jgi:hypothetical protein